MTRQKLLGTTATVGLFGALAAVASAAAQEPSVDVLSSQIQVLEQAIIDRDAVIIDLINRVRQLEENQPADPETGETETAATAATDGAPTGDELPPPPSETQAGITEVDPEDAERALDVSLVNVGGLLLAPGRLQVTPSVSYTRSEQNVTSLIGGTQLFIGDQESDRDIVGLDLSARLGLPWDSQVELSLPARAVRQEDVTLQDDGTSRDDHSTGYGLGDISVGLSKTLAREDGWRPDLIGNVGVTLPTGEESDNGVFLGGGFTSFEVGLSATKRQDPLVFVLSGSHARTLEHDNIKPGPATSLGFTTLLAASPETSLRWGLSTTFFDDTEFDGRDIDGSGGVAASLTFGGSSVIGPGRVVDLSTSIGLTDDASAFSVRLSLPMSFRRPLF